MIKPKPRNKYFSGHYQEGQQKEISKRAQWMVRCWSIYVTPLPFSPVQFQYNWYHTKETNVFISTQEKGAKEQRDNSNVNR